MKKKKILSVVLSAFLATGTVVPCFGATTQEKITDAKEQNAQTQSTLEETREKIQDLESKKGESETYLAELNGQLEELKDNLQQIQTDYDQKQEELVTLQQELEEAKQDEQEQYESMKVRIRYMYEKSTNSYLSLLFESDSIAEFLNQADYIAKITEYDRDMLEQYTQTKEEIAAKEEQVSQEKDEIEALRQESVLQQEAVEELVESTYNQIRTYQEELAGAQSQESQLLTEIEQQNEEINSLLRQAKDKQRAKRSAAKKAAQEAAAKEAQEEAARQAAEKAQQDAADAAAEETKGSSSQDSSSQNAASGSSSSSQKQETGTSSQENTSSDSSTQSSADTSQGKYLGRFKLTAYCTCSICCGSWAGGGTASGTTPTPGRTIAMGGVPFGTKLMINGTVYTVEDRGTAYGHVDILMGSHSQALQFGLQYADVYLVS